MFYVIVIIIVCCSYLCLFVHLLFICVVFLFSSYYIYIYICIYTFMYIFFSDMFVASGNLGARAPASTPFVTATAPGVVILFN